MTASNYCLTTGQIYCYCDGGALAFSLCICGGDYGNVCRPWCQNGGGTILSACYVGGTINCQNTYNGCYSSAVGGCRNITSGVASFIGGGFLNLTQGACSSVISGTCNITCGSNSVIGSGGSNIAYGSNSVIGGGLENKTCGNCSFVGGGYSNIASGDYSFAGGGQCNTASGSRSTVSGGYNNIACGEYSTVSGGRGNTASGFYSFAGGGYSNTASGDYSGAFGCELTASAACTFYVNNMCVCGTLSKASGSFKIPHPNPIKAEQGKFLKHSFVESPTSGDNIYRFNVTTSNCSASIELPDYYSLLNSNDHVYVNAKKHLGYGFGIVNEGQTCVNITTNSDGEYNVLLIGTRKDKAALDAWNGTEVYAVE